MTTVADLMEVLQQVKDPSITQIFFCEVDKNGELLKKQSVAVEITECMLLKKDFCTHADKETCGCVDVDILNIHYRE